MGYTGTASAGKTYISTGIASSPTFASIGTKSGLSGIIFGNNLSAFTAIATSNNGVMITSNTGVPSFLANGTTGQVLTATTGSPPSWTNPASSGTVTLVSGTPNQVSVANGTTTPVVSLIGPYTPSTFTPHGVLVGEGTSSIVSVGPGATAGQIFQSQGLTTDPSFSTATYPSTTTINQILYSSSANAVSGLSTANNGTLITSNTGVPSFLANGTTGQILTATTSGPPTWQNPATSGTVTSVTGTANRITSTGGTTPQIDISAAYVGQTSITTLGTITTGTWNGATVGVGFGGTGATTLTGLLTGNGTSLIVGTAINQYSVITGGSTNLPNSVAPSATVGNPLVSAGASAQPIFSATPTVTSITISNAPSSGTDGANKTYVDNAIAAVNPATSVVAATTANLNATYLNGASGIGATLTNAGALAAFTIDGQTPTLGQRVLVKDQTSTFQNGVYTVSTLGTGAVAWILTRALDYDQPSDINSTGVINVLNGTVNALTGWIINSTVTTVGTDPITFIKFSNAPSSVTQYAVLVGGANNLISSVGPSATAGQYLQSGGSSANPVYSTATLPSTATGTGTILRADGTNWVATTTTYPNTNAINTILYASAANVISALATANNGIHVTNSTGVPSVLAGPGTTGNILQSNAAAAPSFSTATYPSSSGGSGKILYDNGTNFVESVPTFPASASATARKIIVSDGTNWVASTETYAVPGTSGNVLTSDGTNWTSAPPSGGGGATLNLASGTLTNAQIKALNTTPIQAVAAPGAGKVIVPIQMLAKLNYGGNNAFTQGLITTLYGTGGSTDVVILVMSGQLTNTATWLQLNTTASFANDNYTNIANKSINFTAAAAVGGQQILGNAANDNTLSWSFLYYIVTI